MKPEDIHALGEEMGTNGPTNRAEKRRPKHMSARPEFKEYIIRNPSREGKLPPEWIISSWLDEALRIKSQDLFRRRIIDIYEYLEESIGAMYEEMGKIYAPEDFILPPPGKMYPEDEEDPEDPMEDFIL